MIADARAHTAWRDAAALELDRTTLADNAARLLFALRGVMLQMIQDGDFGLFERDAAVVEARAAIRAAQGGGAVRGDMLPTGAGVPT